MNLSSLFKRLKLIDEQELTRIVEKQIKEYNPGIRSLANLQQEMDGVVNHEGISPEEQLALYQSAQQRFRKIKIPDTKNPVEALATVTNRPPSPPPISNLPPVPQNMPLQFKVRNKLLTPDTDKSLSTANLPKQTMDKSIASDQVDSQHSAEQSENFAYSALPDIKEKYVDKLSKLTDLLNHNTNIVSQDTSTGELILEGQIIKGSKFSDLISNLYQTSKNYNLLGESEFIKAIGKIIKNQNHFSVKEMIPRTTILSQIKPYLVQGGNGLLKDQIKGLHPNSHLPPGKNIKVLYLY